MILDTDFLIELLRGKDIKIKEKSGELDKKLITKAIASISVMELWRGALQSINSEHEKKKINELLESLFIYNFTEKEARVGGEIESDLLKSGKLIELEDIMIASVARSNNETILTRNIKHFERINGITVESY